MLIFRFETESGVGMYFNKASTNIINDGTSDSKKWPMPYDDERFKTNLKFHRNYMYPDDEMLIGSRTYNMFYERCKDLRKCGLFEFYTEDLYRFGFNSYAQLDRWVSEFEWRLALVDVNVFLNVYEVDERFAVLGHTQCTFRLDKAKRLHSFIATSSEDQIIGALMENYPDSASVNQCYKDFLL